VAVRPDGYIGFSSGRADDHALRRWLQRAGAVAGPVEVPGDTHRPLNPTFVGP
jgi:hypothetical protein